MSFSLAFITQRRLEIAGAVVAAGASFLLPPVRHYGVLAFVVIYLLACFFPKLFRFLGTFADVPQWPMLVSCGVAALFACPDWKSRLVVGALIAAIDGDFWPY